MTIDSQLVCPACTVFLYCARISLSSKRINIIIVYLSRAERGEVLAHCLVQRERASKPPMLPRLKRTLEIMNSYWSV